MSEHGKKPWENLPDGSHHYRSFVGWPDGWDVLSTMQFNLLILLGLKEDHYLHDTGCGSLRTGRLLIPYLLPGHYFGMEPETWLLEEGIKNEIGNDLIKIKAPQFSNDTNFTITQSVLILIISTHIPYLLMLLRLRLSGAFLRQKSV